MEQYEAILAYSTEKGKCTAEFKKNFETALISRERILRTVDPFWTAVVQNTLPNRMALFAKV